CSGGRRATRCRHARLSYGQPDKATPVPRQRTPATQPGQWGSQPPHHQTDRARPSSPRPTPTRTAPRRGQQPRVAAWTLDKTSAISARPVHDLDAPGAPGGEQLVRVDLVDPTEKVAFGVIVCRPIHGSAPG